MSTSTMINMNSGFQIPQLGFGVFQIPKEATGTAVISAVEAGYRLIDTAQGYENEEGVGAAISQSPVPRNELSSPRNWLIANRASIRHWRPLTAA